MTHYDKIAIFTIRMTSLALILYGLYEFVDAIKLSWQIPDYPWNVAFLKDSFVWMMMGGVLFFLSKPLGRMVGNGL